MDMIACEKSKILELLYVFEWVLSVCVEGEQNPKEENPKEGSSSTN